MKHLITIALLFTFTLPVIAQDDCTFTQLATAQTLGEFVTELSEFYGSVATMTEANTMTFFAKATEYQREWLFDIKADTPDCNELNRIVRYIDDNISSMHMALFYIAIGDFDAAEDYIDFAGDAMNSVTAVTIEISESLGG